jgi:two-component system, NtrC family, nitrogen regulation sensor histidine kinase NtrY
MATWNTRQRKNAAVLLASGLLLLFVALGSEAAFNLKFLHPRSYAQIVIFTGLSLLAFLLLVTVLILLLRNILKLYADQRSSVLGSRLRTRLMVGALLLSFAPVLTMFLFSYILMNRSVDRWFSQPITGLHEDADGIAQQLTHYATDNARAEAEAIADEPGIIGSLAQPVPSQTAINDALRDHKITLQNGFALIFRDGELVSSYQLPVVTGPISGLVGDKLVPIDIPSDSSDSAPDIPQTLLHAAQRTDEPILNIPTAQSPQNDNQYVTAVAPIRNGGIGVVGLPLPSGLPATIAHIRQGTADYLSLGRARRGVRSTFLLVLSLLTAVVLFASSWLALFLSKQITRPVEDLADAMAEIAEGHYSFRLSAVTSNELRELVTSFNHMAADLESSRAQLVASTAELSQANLALDTRRREIETILDTIPLSVLGISLDFRILHANRVFVELFSPAVHGDTLREDLAGSSLADFFPAATLPELERLLRRSHRMGLAGKELEVRLPTGLLNLSIIVASLDRRGYIVVLEDVTSLLRAQKQMAWKEVAQRVAHEIKNPLTPIAISAERIRRYVDRGTMVENTPAIRSSSEVITKAVESLRALVDQFAELAQFPSVQLAPVSLNSVVEDTLRLFSGRLDGITLRLDLHPSLPPVMADSGALQRALTNLIDNAAEAMHASFLRELTVQTLLHPSGHMAEVAVADSGPGISEEVREHLFLPWFSTKQRGSGLGLAIASQVVQEHHGFIRAEKNYPGGARFVIELPLADTPVPTNGSSSAANSNGARVHNPTSSTV